MYVSAELSLIRFRTFMKETDNKVSPMEKTATLEKVTPITVIAGVIQDTTTNGNRDSALDNQPSAKTQQGFEGGDPN